MRRRSRTDDEFFTAVEEMEDIFRENEAQDWAKDPLAKLGVAGNAAAKEYAEAVNAGRALQKAQAVRRTVSGAQRVRCTALTTPSGHGDTPNVQDLPRRAGNPTHVEAMMRPGRKDRRIGGLTETVVVVCFLLVTIAPGGPGCKTTGDEKRPESKPSALPPAQPSTNSYTRKPTGPKALRRKKGHGKVGMTSGPPSPSKVPITVSATTTLKSWKEVVRTARAMAGSKSLSETRVAGLLGVTLRQTSQSPYWATYKARISKGVFASVELRLKKDGKEALVFLHVRPKADRAALERQIRTLGHPTYYKIASPPIARPGRPPGPGHAGGWVPTSILTYLMHGQHVQFAVEKRKGRSELAGVSIEWKKR